MIIMGFKDNNITNNKANSFLCDKEKKYVYICGVLK